MSRFDFIGNFNLKVAAKSVDDVLKYVKSRVSVINSNVNVVYKKAQVNRIEQDFRNVNKEIKKTGELTDDLASIFANATRRFAGVSIATATLLSLVRGVKNAYSEVIQFEREMIRVAQAQDKTIASTRDLSKEISRLSVAYGTNALELAKTGRVLAQAGFNAKTTSKALEILAKINLAGTFGETEENVEGMISILQQFGSEARAAGTEAQFLQEKFDIINKISKKYAVESSDIITAVSKAGGAFESSGGSLEEFIASITAVRSATRESAATIANGFKTIFTRLQRAETIESLRALGVELVDAEGKFVGPIEALERLGRTLSVLQKGDVRFTQIAEEIGGIYQVNRLITLIKQQDVVQQALNDTREAAGDIDKDVNKGLESTISKIDRLNASFSDLIKTFSETETFRTIIDYMIKMAETAIAVTKALEPITPLLLAGIGFQGINLGSKIFKRLAGFAADPKSVPTIAANNLATGGTVRGGKGGIDDVPAMLTRGEFVINKKASMKYRDLLAAINSGKKIQMFSEGGTVEDRINTKTRSNLKTSKSTLGTVKQVLRKKMQDLAKKNSQEAQKLANVLDPENTFDTLSEKFLGSKKAIGMNSKKFSPYVLDHEIGHAVDKSGGTSNGRYASQRPGTFNNTIVEASREAAATNAIASGMDKIPSSNGMNMAEYRAQDTEIFAEIFANLQPEGQKLLLKLSSVSNDAEDVSKALQELEAAIDTGKVDFGKNINENIKNASKVYSTKSNQVNQSELQKKQEDLSKYVAITSRVKSPDISEEELMKNYSGSYSTSSYSKYSSMLPKLGEPPKNMQYSAFKPDGVPYKSSSPPSNKPPQDPRYSAFGGGGGSNNPFSAFLPPPKGPNGPSGSSGSSGSSGGGSNDPNKASNDFINAQKTTGQTLLDFGKKAGLAVAGAGLLAEYMQLLPKEVSVGVSSFTAGFASVQLTFSALSDIFGSFLKQTDMAQNAMGALNNATKASAVSELQEVAANQAAVASETAESVANLKGGVGGLTKTTSKFGGSLSGVVGKLNALGFGISTAVGIYSSINALQLEYINNLKKTNDEIIDRARTGKERVGDDKLFKDNLAKLGDSRARNDRLSGEVGVSGVAGAFAGVAIAPIIGGLIGTALGPIGTAVGSVAGAIVGSGIGYLFNQLSGNTEDYIQSTILASEANYKAAKATASFDRTLKAIKDNGIGASAATKILDKEFEKASVGLREARSNTLKVDIATSQSSGLLDTIGTGIGIFDPAAKSENQKEILAEAQKAEQAQRELLQRVAEQRNASIKDDTLESINKATNDQEINAVLATLQERAAKIKENTISASTETDPTKREQEGEAARKAFIENNIKTGKLRSEETSKINASRIARELEIEAIKRTTQSMISLAEQGNNLDVASSLIDQVTTGFSKGVSGSRFSDISKIGDIDKFERDARSVASNLGPDGQATATSAVMGARFVSDLRKNLTTNLSADFDKLRSSGLGKAGNANEIERILGSTSTAFLNLTREQKDFAINTIQSQIGKEGFNIDTLDKTIGDISGVFQKEADVLAKQADLANEQIEKIRSVNQILQEAYLKQADLQIGLLDVQQRGQDRLSKVFDAVLTGTDRNAIMAQQERGRINRANISLNASGVGSIAGNTGALSATLRDAQARLNRNNQAVEGESNIQRRTALLTENQRLNQAIKATTDELTRLSNQSERASDVMSQIEREQSKRSFIANQATDFITGSRQDRFRMLEEERAMQNVLTTGTFQNLPDDLKKAALSGLEERAKLDDTGNIQKLLDRAKVNDARALGANPQQINALLNRPSTKEEMLINELRGISQEETRAQLALINAQNANTNVMRDLLVKVNSLLGQPMRNVPQQAPIGFNGGGPNPIINNNGFVNPNIQRGQQMNNGMQTVTDNINKMTNAISGMKVDHQININGQINVGGLNLKNVEMQLARGLEGFIVQKVTEVINKNGKGFRAGA